ncbi:MAG TPA: biosynthetic peptidoglycan transglycosylase, partial [Polyangiaceae bacterium]|nr:biosynthetic peptidoglycan transglycosylase [Polyangiaceae bacterium]
EMPNLHVLRAMIQNAGQRLAERAPDGLHVALDALGVDLKRGKEKLELGPGKLVIERHGSELALDFSAGTGQTPLTLHASVPLEAGDTTLALAGGPVTLSMLGVRDGAFGFVDPARANVTGKARVTLDDAAKSLTFDADVSASGVSIKNAKLADDTVRGLDVRVSARGVLDDAGAVRLDDSEAQLGALHLRTHGGVEQTSDHLSASLSFELPVAGCQSILESFPAALFPHVSQARFRGTFGAKGYLSFDTRKIDDLVLKYDIDDLCRVTQAPEELKKDHFDGAFTYAIIDKDGKPADRETGPGSDEWAPIDTISPMMQVAVLTTEDGAFFHHHGFNEWAIKASLVANIKAGRFVRGASTITMQLAKNLFLSREKTLSRKLEELILADYLERTFKKEEMMEIYLNIIEFGPDLYGVKSAAWHYFGRQPAELNLAECLFLSSLLPKPREYHKLYEKGEAPQSWISNIRQLMEIAHKNGRISDKELEEGKEETIVFHKEDAPPPVPRAAVTGSHFTGDDAWEAN